MIIHGHNHCEKMRKCQDYIQALEVERNKIQVFQRELPLCLELVTQAIETCKQQLTSGTTSLNQSECNSEQTSSDVPVFEEFMPIKRGSCHSDDEGEEEDDDQENKSSKKQKNNNNNNNNNDSDKTCKKSDWLRSVQLWNQTPDPPTKQNSPRKVAVTEVKRNGSGGAFHPFKKLDKNHSNGDATTSCAAPPPVSTSSTAETGGSSGNNNIIINNDINNNKKDQGKDGQSSNRKSRRCWSPELHRRFLQALQQLGGSHVATPKQIRELMKVDGLTNDEVKSHLQKYRLHTRRPATSMHNNNNNSNVQPPQFVVVGGIWVPPEYANMAATTAAASREVSGVAQSNNGVYAPIAALPPPFQGASTSPKQKHQHKSSNSDERGSHSEGHVRSHSPETSSSTHTTTASPAY